MWRSSRAIRARGLSRLSVQRELSSFSTLVHSGDALALTDCHKEAVSWSQTLIRSFSDGKQPSQRRTSPSSAASSTPSKRPLREDQRAHQRVSAKDRPPTLKSVVTFDEASQHIAFLDRQLSELESLPPVWSAQETPIDSADEREAIFDEAQALLGRIENTVNSQQLNLSGKHGRELSYLLGQILEVYSQTAVPIGDGTSVFDACCRVMALLQEWNLDIQPRNFACAVEVAARESRWKEASYLFWEQIDPDAHGYTPMEISRHLAVGLYVVARNSQMEGGATVDHVMDAVLRMSMVCPTDQDHYVLSAGLALGHAGEGESFANYLANSYNSSRLGQPLTAAVMNACILSGRADKALEVFQELVADPLRAGSEWQYGGEYNAMNPLCRDVAMRAMGASSSENASDLALELYQQVRNDELQISVDAICGVVKACERDGRWEEAVELLIEFMDRCHDPYWLVDGNDTMAIVPIEEAIGSDNMSSPDIVLRRALPQIGSMVASVMRSCNAVKKFGVALLCCHLAGDSLVMHDHGRGREPDTLSTMLLSRFKCQEEPVVAAMVSLCGLDCHRDAVQLYSDALEWFPDHAWHDAHDCCTFARSSHSVSDSVLPNPWESAYRHVQLLTKACAMLEAANQKSDSQIKILASALSKAMRACIAAGQPEASLLLAKRVDDAIASRDDTTAKQPFSIGNAMASFFGYQDSQPYQVSQPDKDSLLSDTSVLAETVSAYRTMSRPEEGLKLLEQIPESFGSENSPSQGRGRNSDARWIPVVNQAIRLLSDQNGVDDAHALFKATNETTQDHETLIAMATAFEKQKQWKDIIKIYYYAQNCGLLSENLGVLAMKAAVESASKDLAQQLRLIAKSVSELSGRKENQWLASHYWSLERYLGWNATRLLMWWKDAATANEMKLHFAVEQLEARQKAGLTPKNAALRFVVDTVRTYDSPTEILPFNRTQWLELLRAVLAEAENSSLWNNPKFVESACMSLYWLGGRQECVEFAQNAKARGVHITHTTVVEVTELARAEGLDVDDLFLLSKGF